MKIANLEIKKLHSLYDYHVQFNEDLTFLYGENGCGKTTVLNIIEAIVSGRLFDLFIWRFEEISLNYFDETQNENDLFSIRATLVTSGMQINYEDEAFVIEEFYFRKCCDDADTYEELFDFMSERYPLLREIKEKFNYIYLPLNRHSSVTRDYFSSKRFMRPDRRRRYYDDSEGNFIKNEETIGVARLIERSYLEAVAKIRNINDAFRNRILKSLLMTNTNLSEEDFLKFLSESIRGKSIDIIKDQYIAFLESLSLLEQNDKKEYAHFFDSYKKKTERIIKSQEKGSPVKIPISLIYDYHEIAKMKSVIHLAQEAEKEKTEALSKIDLFIKTMNSFITEGLEEKRIEIGNTGRIKLVSKNFEGGVSISHLSSGEKQLLIFFANLIFNVDKSMSSIFVVDEPELSLHLNWQRMFVETALKIKANTQFIFATHSPEIVGRFRNRMVKLTKAI